MSEHMQNLAVENYKKNLEYFEQDQKAVYDKLAALDSAVMGGHYTERYALTIEDDYFEVVELSTNNKLYSQNSNDYAKLAAKSVNYKRDDAVFESFKNIAPKQENLQKHASEDITLNPLNGCADILDYINKNNIENSEMLYIKKFIFFGVGLGTHISSIHQKISADVYLIVEDDLELFKLSLFVTPYYELAKESKLFFSVFDENEEFNRPALNFLATRFYDNHLIKYFHMLNHSEDKQKLFHLKVASQSHNLFFYSTILDQFTRPLYYMNNNYNFLNLLNKHDGSPLHLQKVLFLAAGPSLKKNIKWLKQNHNKFIIVALSSILNILHDEGIKPNIVTHLDGFESSKMHFTKLPSLEFLNETTFLLSARCERDLVDMLDKRHVFFFENSTSYKMNHGNLSAYCVGSTTYLILLALGVKDIYLLGLDLAIDSNTGLTHIDEHEFVKRLDTDSANSDDDIISFKDSLVSVKGNLCDEVLTTPDFLLSIGSINTSSNHFKKADQSIYNLNNGAYFSNTISAHIDEINTAEFKELNSSDISEQIFKTFKQNSSNTISKQESDNLLKIKEHAFNLKEIINEDKKSVFENAGSFLSAHTLMIKKLISKEKNQNGDIALIFQEYLKLIDTFIFDFFNTKEIRDDSKHIAVIHSLLNAQLLRIVDRYLLSLS